MRRSVLVQKRGFTLIELLCVIAIIGILAGLLMPAMTNFSEKSDGVKCLSNLRQIGAALIGYVGEHDGVIPEVQTDPNNPTYLPPSEAKGLLDTFGKYGVTTDVVKCPADVRDPSANYFVKYGTSYEWKPFADDENPLSGGVSVYFKRGELQLKSRIIPASKIAVCSDVETVHGKNSPTWSKKNYLYADGHVRFYWDTVVKPQN